MTDFVAAALLTLALHTAVLLLGAWLLDRGALRALPAWRELLWRTALFGALFTTATQMLFDSPLSSRLSLSGAAAAPTPAAIVARTVDTTAAPATGTAAGASANRASPAALPRAVAARTTVALPLSWSRLLVAAWLAGALLAVLRVALHWLRLERLLARARDVVDSHTLADAGALAAQAHIRMPRLATLAQLASPIAARRARIVLPSWVPDRLGREQVRAMLAHEIAHLARRDPAWKLATALWCACLWFLPPTRLARRRLDEVAELACDAWAARLLGDGRALAECLAECAEHRGGFDPVLAPAMARRGSPFLHRIDHLLEGQPMNMRIAGGRAFAAALLGLVLCASVLPGFAARAQPAPPAPPSPPAPPAPPRPPTSTAGTRIHISRDAGLSGETTLIEVGDDAHNYSATIRGKITFNEGYDEVASLGDGGSARFVETRDGIRRQIDYRSQGGQLTQRYFVDDREQALDAAGRQWLAQIIATLVRESAIDVEGRVRRLLAKGGPDTVLDEVARIESGYARAAYLKQLVAIGGALTATQVTRALDLVDAIDSDYERRNALTAIGSSQSLDPAQQALVVGQAGKIESDFERAELLTGLLPKLAPDGQLRAAWLAAANGIGSDFEHRRTLSALLVTAAPDDDTLVAVIGAAKTIGSDFERRTLLTDAIGHVHDADRVAGAYVASTAGIGSDFELREALLALVHADGFGGGGARAVLDAAGSIGSDHECSELLVALAQVMPADADLISRYRAAARRLGDFERANAERALDRFAS